MKTVYAVNSGCYSDFGVDAIFSTRKKAEEYMLAFPDDFNDIIEYTLDPPDAAMPKSGFMFWSVWMLRNGDVEKVETVVPSTYSLRDEPYVWRRPTAPDYRGKNAQDVLMLKTWAKTSTAAIKIANEKRVELIATGGWE